MGESIAFSVFKGSADPAAERRFRILVRHLLGIEGGHVNHAADKGGETKFGISLRFLVLEGKIDLNGDGIADFDLDMDGDIDGADIRLLTPELAIDLYRRCFWERERCWSYPAPIDGMIFDQAINGGAVAARKLFQRALNICVPASSNVPLVVDGDIGSKSRARLAVALEKKGVGMTGVINAYRDAAAERYRDIAVAAPSQRVFLAGWLNRAKRLGNV